MYNIRNRDYLSEVVINPWWLIFLLVKVIVDCADPLNSLIFKNQLVEHMAIFVAVGTVCLDIIVHKLYTVYTKAKGETFTTIHTFSTSDGILPTPMYKESHP